MIDAEFAATGAGDILVPRVIEREELVAVDTSARRAFELPRSWGTMERLRRDARYAWRDLFRAVLSSAGGSRGGIRSQIAWKADRENSKTQPRPHQQIDGLLSDFVPERGGIPDTGIENGFNPEISPFPLSLAIGGRFERSSFAQVTISRRGKDPSRWENHCNRLRGAILSFSTRIESIGPARTDLGMIGYFQLRSRPLAAGHRPAQPWSVSPAGVGLHLVVTSSGRRLSWLRSQLDVHC